MLLGGLGLCFGIDGLIWVANQDVTYLSLIAFLGGFALSFLIKGGAANLILLEFPGLILHHFNFSSWLTPGIPLIFQAGGPLEVQPLEVHVVEYLTVLPPKAELEQKLHQAVINAKLRLDNKE